MLSDNFGYTPNMKILHKNRVSELKSYYCKEDFEQALYTYDHSSKDYIKFVKNDLKSLCKARGIDVDKLIKNREILNNIPTHDQIKDELLKVFYDMCKASPSTTDHMKRIIHRLAPEFENDSVRVAILKKFVLGSKLNFKKFKIESVYMWVREQLSEKDKKDFDSLDEEGKKEIVISKLNDSIFDREALKLTNSEILCLILNKIEEYSADESISFSELELKDETRAKVRELLVKYKSVDDKPSDRELVKFLLEAMKSDAVFSEHMEGEQSPILMVEKDFRAQLKKIERVSRTGKKGDMAEMYKQAKKDAKNAKNAKASKSNVDLDLLELCNDLAEGKFNNNGKTRVQLYYFAFMFGMTVSINGRNYDDERDFSKNLLEDFYNDNLLRLLSGVYNDPKLSSSIEKEPTGEGINYKNFVEAIYIYFLYRDDLNLTPGEKIDMAENTIDKCIKLSKGESNENNIEKSDYTKKYKTETINKLLETSVKEIPQFVVNNYLVRTPENIGSVRIMVASEENTASDRIGKLIDHIDSIYSNYTVFDKNELKDMESRIKDDIDFMTDSELDWKVSDLLRNKYGCDSQFMKILDALDSRVHIDSGRYNKTERERMLVLLNILYTYSDKDNPVSISRRVIPLMHEKGVICVDQQFSAAVSALKKLGFDICRDNDYIYLGERQYSDENLASILRKVSQRYFTVDNRFDESFSKILVERLGVNRRITRCDMIALHLSYYISSFDEEDGLDTFPKVFSDYEESVNKYLVDARYQPLREKNVFDMYAVITLYFYLLENKKYLNIQRG